MSSKDQESAEFAHSNSYSRFASNVRSSRRYVMDDEQQSFLQTVLATVSERDHELKLGDTFYRAQRGVDWCVKTDDDGNWIDEDVRGFGPARMKPITNRAREGRANALGIPALYVANTVETAISEVRPWVGADISLATCKIIRPLRILDLSVHQGKSSGVDLRHLMGGPEPTLEEKTTAVWTAIDNAFSIPVVASDDQANYAPTQILAELFQSAGYEAIAYKSHFGDDEKKKGYNIAIFDIEAVEVVSCAPYRVQSIKVEATQFGNPWFKSNA